MDGRDQPDTKVVRIRRRGDPSEAERRRLASTIFAEPDDVATFSRGNLVPPRPNARDANEELAPSSDPFFDRLPAESKTDGTPRTDLPDPESADAYFDRLATQSPAEMSTNGAPALAVTPMPGSALLPAELARPSSAPRSPAAATYPARSGDATAARAPALTVRFGSVHGHARGASRARRWDRRDW